jgi:hypothetical protein
MNSFFDKTPRLGAGLAWYVMNKFLTQVKSQRGLTAFAEHHGINGRWLKPDAPFDIRFKKFIKILEVKAHYQTDEEFLNDWKALGDEFLTLVRAINYARKIQKSD